MKHWTFSATCVQRNMKIWFFGDAFFVFGLFIFFFPFFKHWGDLTASVSDGSYRCTIALSHDTVLVPLWLSNTLPPFPDLYFPVGQSTANPKSLPASPWRRASVEQMASVCRAAIKEGATGRGKESGSGSRGSRAGNVKLPLPLPQACAQTYAFAHLVTCADTHTKHKQMCVFPPQCTSSWVFPAKTNTHPTLVTKHQQCVSESRGVRQTREVRRISKHAPWISHTKSLQWCEVRETSTKLHGQIPPPNQ